MPRRVFISYSHDSPEHAGRVLELANTLRRKHSVHAWVDQYEQSIPAAGWLQWMRDHVTTAVTVLVVCTERYAERFSNPTAQTGGYGVQFESVLAQGDLAKSPETRGRYVAVVLSPNDRRHVPVELFHSVHLLDGAALHTCRALTSLAAYLRGNAGVTAPPLGEHDPADQTHPHAEHLVRTLPADTVADALHTARTAASPGDPRDALIGLLRYDPEGAARVLRELVSLAPQLAPHLPRQDTPTPAPPPPTQPPPAPPPRAPLPPPIVDWFRTRFDRSKPWGRITEHVQHQRTDRAFLLVGDAAQQPALFTRRLGAQLPQVGAPPPVLVRVPVPHHDYPADSAAEVEALIAAALRELPTFHDLPPESPRATLRRAACAVPVVIDLGGPLRRVPDAERPALLAFLRDLRSFVGAPEGRYPVRFVVVVEEPKGGTLYADLRAALKASSVEVEIFDRLTFPPWDEVHEQLARTEHLRGVDTDALRDAYADACETASDLTDLTRRIFEACDRLRDPE